MSSRPRLLDLFCCQGGAGYGYHLAGFEVVGVDIVDQPRYPFEFHRADALEYVAAHGHEFDAIHASPPCQKFTTLGNLHHKNGYAAKHVDLIAATRAALRATGKPYVIENVPTAPLENPIMLCGSMFGLRVYRHRCFETSWLMLAPYHVPHHDNTPSAGRGKSDKGFVCVSGTGGVQGVPYAYLCGAMGSDWMDKYGLSQSIPPAYTQYIGAYLMDAITMEIAA
jgi:DNA (cytosine-5)-methyltransferase 1